MTDQAVPVLRHASVPEARILIVDDEPANAEFLRLVLKDQGYGHLMNETDARAAADSLPLLAPDLIILDLMMPGLDGFQFMERVKSWREPESYLPILVVTGDTTTEARRRALEAGAADFLTKPVSPTEVRLRVRNLLHIRLLHEELRGQNAQLEERVRYRTAELEEARQEILDRLARAAEFRDDDTGQHTQRVGYLSARLAQILAVESEQVELIRKAAPLHDIGKIGIPDTILLKSGPLTADERSVMETHTTIGARILSGSRYPLLRLAEEIAMTHHERWDGAGYPNGLAGDAIPICGRIVAVADVFDSLTHIRPYKPAWTVKETLAHFRTESGRHFDPSIVEALLRVAPEVGALTGRFNGLPMEAPSRQQLRIRLQGLEAERDELNLRIRDLRRTLARDDPADAVSA
jgi:putative two-component system response regulator